MTGKYIFPQVSTVFCFILLLSFKAFGASPDPRSDSFDVTHYTIALDITHLSGKSINGSCQVSGLSRIDGLNHLSLELYKLAVDSVVQNGKTVANKYNDSLLNISFDKVYNTGDSFAVTVWYHGQPVTTSWGGFYFNSSYAFNLGIGLYANPPNFGRVWFPCVDNFVDKALFSFYIKTKNGSKAFCNGLLSDSVANADNTLTWHWEMKEPVVPYLASVAVGPYATVYTSFKSINTVTKPVLIGVLPGDVNIAKTSFEHLPQILAEYEKAYGPYPFDRVGFVGVDFGSGAMEHASNIALPNATIEGGLSDEYLWAHELSHQWWGDLVTCQSASEMWLNEGWASYNEAFCQEKLYGVQAYNTYAMGTHYQALRYAHIVDGTDLPISPMPAAYTYGPTIYEKGAGVVRALRNYLGDSLFFIGVKTYLQKDYKFSSASSLDFQTSLTKSTGVDMSGFFHDWVFGAGWPHFEISSMVDSGGSSNIATITLRTVDNNFSYDKTPLTVSYFNAGWKRTDVSFKYSTTGTTNTKIPVGAELVALDIDGKVSDATTKQYQTIKAKGTTTFSESLINITTDSLKDSALVYVTHNWIAPARTQGTPRNIKLSTDRYWTVDGIFTNGFHATALLQYDGRVLSSPYSGGFLDNDFLQGVKEDSIVLMYKPLYGGDWTLQNPNTDYVKTTGSSHADAFGDIKILTLKRGQYCFGIYDYRAGVASPSAAKIGMEIFPNPAVNSLNIKFDAPVIVKSVQIFDTNGKLVKAITNPMTANGMLQIVDMALPNGIYLAEVTTAKGISSQRFVVGR